MVPFSRRFPQFSRKALATSLEGAGIEYWFLGGALGARPKDQGCYEQGKVSYARIAATTAFGDAIDALIGAARTKRVALMCAEKEPLDCHLTILVSRRAELNSRISWRTAASRCRRRLRIGC